MSTRHRHIAVTCVAIFVLSGAAGFFVDGDYFFAAIFLVFAGFMLWLGLWQ